MSEVNWAAIRAEYELGLSLRQLAAKYAVSKSAIGERKFKEQWDASRHPGRTLPRTENRTENRTAPTVHPMLDENPTPEKSDLSTKDRQRLFIEAYAKHANVLVSAKEAGVHRSTVYDWLEHDQDFSFAYNLAKEDAKDTLRAEIYRRATEGWDEPVYQFGQLAGTVRKCSDTLLIFHAKMLMPEYRDKSQLDVKAQVSHAASDAYAHLSDDELDDIERILLTAQERMHRHD